MQPIKLENQPYQKRNCRTCHQPRDVDDFEIVRYGVKGQPLRKKDCRVCQNEIYRKRYHRNKDYKKIKRQHEISKIRARQFAGTIQT